MIRSDLIRWLKGAGFFEWEKGEFVRWDHSHPGFMSGFFLTKSHAYYRVRLGYKIPWVEMEGQEIKHLYLDEARRLKGMQVGLFSGKGSD
jgi:hypothetical protein